MSCVHVVRDDPQPGDEVVVEGEVMTLETVMGNLSTGWSMTSVCGTVLVTPPGEKVLSARRTT